MPSGPRVRYVYDNVTVHKRRKIPHWRVPYGLYFITLRLVDSLPHLLEQKLAVLREQLLRAREHTYAAGSAITIEREIFRLTQLELDRGRGVCHLARPAVAEMIMESCDFHDQQRRCDMIAVAVMPNHLHLVFRLPDGKVDKLVRSWKSFMAHEANRLLGREGGFWQEDYFDVLMRDSTQLEKTVSYVLDNPAKAGLIAWPWTKIWAETYASAT